MDPWKRSSIKGLWKSWSLALWKGMFCFTNPIFTKFRNLSSRMISREHGNNSLKEKRLKLK